MLQVYTYFNTPVSSFILCNINPSFYIIFTFRLHIYICVPISLSSSWTFLHCHLGSLCHVTMCLHIWTNTTPLLLDMLLDMVNMPNSAIWYQNQILDIVLWKSLLLLLLLEVFSITNYHGVIYMFWFLPPTTDQKNQDHFKTIFLSFELLSHYSVIKNHHMFLTLCTKYVAPATRYTSWGG